MYGEMDANQLDDTFVDIYNHKKEIKLSGMIMVKNQEGYILKSINSVLPYVDQLVVIDTGSTDNTINEINSIKNPKLSLEHLEWVEDFALMRNKCMLLTRENWLIYIDSDETIERFKYPESLKIIIALSEMIHPSVELALQAKVYANNASAFLLIGRILKKEKSLYFYGKVHEEPRIRNPNQQLVYVRTSIKITNYGSYFS